MDEIQGFQDRCAAYKGSPPPELTESGSRLKYRDLEPPLRWTPEWVLLRLEFAFEALLATSFSVGPRSYKGMSWSVCETLALGEVEAYNDMVAEMQEEALRRPPKFTSIDIAYSEEALSWPSAYLADSALMRDAIMLYCLCLATGKPAAPILRQRKAVAAALATKMQGQEDARRKEARQTIAAATAAWANKKIAMAGSNAQVEKIRANARIKFERAVKSAGLLPGKVKPHEAMPGIVLAPSTMDKYRKLAAGRLSERLHLARVPVR